jgi:hypothetical protein
MFQYLVKGVAARAFAIETLVITGCPHARA